jgi:hypothetical protein
MGVTRTFPSFANHCPPCEAPPPSCVSCHTQLPIEKVAMSELTPEVQYAALEAPTAYIERHVKQAAITVARDLGVLKRKVTMDIQKGVRDYYPCPEEGERWHKVNSICICGHCIEFAEPPCCDTACKCGIGRYGWFESPDKIQLSWSPEKDMPGSIVIEMVAVPKLDACDLDAWFAEVYAEAIQAKALSAMRRDKGGGKEPHSWYDPQLARELTRVYETEIMGRHKNDLSRQYGNYDYQGPG